MKSPIYIEGYNGLGDNIYQRPFIHELTRIHEHIFLQTPWPQLYKDMTNISFVNPHTTLRTQSKNVRRTNNISWANKEETKRKYPVTIMKYTAPDLMTMNILESFAKAVNMEDLNIVMNLPKFDAPLPFRTDKPICLVRPVTVRSEWVNEERNPNPEYVYEYSKMMGEKGYYVVSIADIEKDKEWALPPLPKANETFHKGELNIEQLMTLVQTSSVLLGGVGWIVPAALATKTPAFIVLGGQGDQNAPDKITDPRVQSNHIVWATPDNFCRCSTIARRGRRVNAATQKRVNATHSCDKTITDRKKFFDLFLKNNNITKIKTAKNGQRII